MVTWEATGEMQAYSTPTGLHTSTERVDGSAMLLYPAGRQRTVCVFSG